MKTLILILLLVAPFSTSADERYYLWTASTVALLADWGTTLDIDCAEGYYETNKWLGECPSRFEVNRYFTGLLTLHVVGNWAIQQIPNPDIRRLLLYSQNLYVTVEHGSCALNNFQIGLKMNF